jgi:hypothetical protein
MTTTTQLGLAISQTCEDLYEVLNVGNKNSFSQSERSHFEHSERD